MSNTAKLGLPLVQAAQAQKHVTVNEALVRLDGLAQLTLKSTSLTTPPGLATDGDCYGVPNGAVNAWAGQAGALALFTNGGWVFTTPQLGWSAWVEDVSRRVLFDGTDWQADVVAMSPHGAMSKQRILEIDHSLSAGPVSTVSAALPAFSMVFGVTGRVTTAITGTLTGWRLGVASADNRYGSGLGLGQGSWVRGLTSAPQTYYADTDLILTAETGDFAGGDIRLAVHYLEITMPNP
ncbi:MAG: DUF2793 domain-containing protein [Marinosulfonomonas sp.]